MVIEFGKGLEHKSLGELGVFSLDGEKRLGGTLWLCIVGLSGSWGRALLPGKKEQDKSR